jgi:hypothetical protein
MVASLFFQATPIPKSLNKGRKIDPFDGIKPCHSKQAKEVLLRVNPEPSA